MSQTTSTPLETAAAALLGTGEIMAAVGRCLDYAWHAACQGNWALAAYFTRRTRKLLQALAAVRPQYAEQVEAFEAAVLAPLLAAATGADRPGFQRAFQRALAESDRYHAETGVPYIRWRPSAQAPTDLDLRGDRGGG